ncbi:MULTISPECIES: hypothetical protein [unclassified Stenotrophomonas]|uniref:hypothetical protein n=1 Tax=unclassified Stenotrophomonas TaxID=196198 RepID=UPI0018E38E76|nr:MULTISPECIES: hypothetical protein [unclassified Stenotrophomonas]
MAKAADARQVPGYAALLRPIAQVPVIATATPTRTRSVRIVQLIQSAPSTKNVLFQMPQTPKVGFHRWTLANRMAISSAAAEVATAAKRWRRRVRTSAARLGS